MDNTIIGNNTNLPKAVEQLTPYLRIQAPNNVIQRYRLPNHPITLGRGQYCDIVLDDEMASRKHCKIWLDSDNAINITDLNSTNGSSIDNVTFKQEILRPNHRLKIGQHIIKLEYKDSEEIRHEELLQTAATCDPLTGISNRKWFEERVNTIIQAIADRGQFIAIIMLDIDHFKQVNDTYGHQTGDVVIKSIADILTQLKRQQDLLARFGGEEFILCLPDSTPEDAKIFCERVRLEISKTRFRFGKKELNVTISLGAYSSIINQESNLTHMTGQADKALYHAKASGRNQTTINLSPNANMPDNN